MIELCASPRSTPTQATPVLRVRCSVWGGGILETVVSFHLATLLYSVVYFACTATRAASSALCLPHVSTTATAAAAGTTTSTLTIGVTTPPADTTAVLKVA